MAKCSQNFESKYAKIDGLSGYISIDDYLANRIGAGAGAGAGTPKCIPNGHELIAVNCTTRRPHFRHKNTCDMEGSPMTKWHSEWQSNFPITEVPFRNKVGQLRNRRADVVIPEFNRIIEIQHSVIDSGEVNERINDYIIHKYEVVWVIHAQDSIAIKRLGDRCILHFTSNYWLYESFLNCPYVYYDINGFIYKVNPNLVRSHQVDVCEAKIKSDFIEELKTQKEFWVSTDALQSYLYVKQKGAGSGKTHGMMQLLNIDPEITNFKCIIFITKQHPAVNVMFMEFMQQYINGQLENIELYKEPVVKDGKLEDPSLYCENKKYIVQYRHKITNVNTYAIFATVDSFTYAIGNTAKSTCDHFAGIVRSIRDGFTKVKRSGALNYAGLNLVINKETIIMVDETQDLEEVYGEAFLKFVSSTHTNLCVVGDRLQSLSNKENALTFLHQAESAMMKVVRENASNVVRRFSDPQLVDFVNAMVPFEKYELPRMSAAKIVEAEPNALTIFSANKRINANQNVDDQDVINEVTIIMTHFKSEVENNGRIPEDFLIVTPFTGKNPLVEALQLAINIYWKETMENNAAYIENVKMKNEYWKTINVDDYTRYAIFHKSEENGSINLNESKNATRLVSIHSSKGDGRKVVFVIGVTESALQKFSQVTNNLIYDSLLHVAITRQKERLYFRLEENGDDINMRIKNSSQVIESSSTKFDFARKNIDISRFFRNIEDTAWEELYNTIILHSTVLQLPKLSDTKLLIDMGDHNIRYSAIFINIIVHCCNYDLMAKSTTKKPFNMILNKLKSADCIKHVNKWQEYFKILTDNNKEGQRSFVPILIFTTRDSDYMKYYNIIFTTMLRIIDELTKIGNAQLNYFCPLESVILYYMIECIESHKYQKITISDLYNIVDTYSKVFDHTSLGHEHCKCKTLFAAKNIINESQRKNSEYLHNHYERLNHVNRIMEDFSVKHSGINWLYNHPVSYKNIEQIDINRRFNLMGYNDTNVYIFNIKPQLSEINFNECLISSIFDTWLISNISIESPNYTRFNNKQIVSCVLSLNREELYTINLTSIINDNMAFLNKYVMQLLLRMYNRQHLQYYNTFMNVVNELKEVKQIFEYCLEDCNKKKAPSATYIVDFLKYIMNDITICPTKKTKKEKLAFYMDENNFLQTIGGFLHRSLCRVLNIENTDEDEDDDEDEE